MPTYPVKITRDGAQRGDQEMSPVLQDPDCLAEKIERYVNDEFAQRGQMSRVFTYAALAHDLEIAATRVRELLSRAGGGQVGITVTKG